MESIKEFPRGITDQAISLRAHDGECERSPGPGLVCAFGRKATSLKLQATSFKPQASSYKQQASSYKLQASSVW